jgi:hypothetical protein
VHPNTVRAGLIDETDKRAPLGQRRESRGASAKVTHDKVAAGQRSNLKLDATAKGCGDPATELLVRQTLEVADVRGVDPVGVALGRRRQKQSIVRFASLNPVRCRFAQRLGVFLSGEADNGELLHNIPE